MPAVKTAAWDLAAEGRLPDLGAQGTDAARAGDPVGRAAPGIYNMHLLWFIRPSS